MNKPKSLRPRLLGAATALLLAGAAFSAHAGSNVQWSLSVGAPGYAYGPAYAPVAYPAYAPGYVVAPPRPVYRHRHHRRPVVCDAYGYCTRVAPVAPVVYAPAPVYYPQQVVIAGGGYGRGGHGYGHGRGHGHGHGHGHRR